MFVLSWIRSSDAQASNKTKSAITSGSDNNNNTHVDQNQDDWVFLPSDHDHLMEASCANLDLLSASTMTLHPASSRTRARTSGISPATHDTPLEPKSRRQLKSEYRRQLAQEQLERKPRYDPFIAKLRDQEFQRAKMAKLALRSGRIMSSTTGGAHSMKSRGSSGAAGAGAAPRSASVKIC